MSTSSTPPPGVPPEEWDRYLATVAAGDSKRSARRGDGMTWEEVMESLSKLPPETPEQAAERERKRQALERDDRMAKFRRLCPPEFCQRIDRDLLADPIAFDKVAGWDGRFPGPLAVGGTNAAKTRAAWSALGKLYVHSGKSIAWFTAKRLITELVRYEEKQIADEFWRHYRGFNVLFVDDVDKINWQFDSELSVLFQFYDWVYREQIPCISTTNQQRSWWEKKTGEALARRMFADAHNPVVFSEKK